MKNISELIKREDQRQKETLMLIPSENYASKKVREAVGSRLMNKYSEGYSGKRYYQGNYFVDQVENLAIDKAKKIFGVESVNVQPYSGSPANMAVLFGLLEKGDKIMGLKLSGGGHLTHGHPEITFSGKYFKSVQFDVDEDGVINYDEVERLALKEKPKLIFVGTTAYPLIINWQRFAKISDKLGAYLVADISHIAGLVAAGVYPSPVKHVHVVTTTTHKTLRGPRGAMIMVTKKGLKLDADLSSKIDKAVFPGLQGGPHNNTTAGIAQALIEADTKQFTKYAKQVVKNAKLLSDNLASGGLKIVCSTTQSHLLVVDLRPLNLSGNVVAEGLEVAGIIVNRNSVPHDSAPPYYPSGIRIGTPAITTRGMKEKEIRQISKLILDVIFHLKNFKLPEDKEERLVFMRKFRQDIHKDKYLLNIKKEVKKITSRFKLP